MIGRESNGFEGAKRPFGCEQSEPSCPGPGSVERSVVDHGPNSLYLMIVHVNLSRLVSWLDLNGFSHRFQKCIKCREHIAV